MKTISDLRFLIIKTHFQECKRQNIKVDIEFDSTIEAAANCNFYMNTRLGRVVDVQNAHSITYNPILIDKVIKHSILSRTHYAKIAKHVITFYVRHEIRHAWQTTYDKEFVIREQNAIDICNLSRGYGERPIEADANEYACSGATGYYKIVSRSLKIAQELHGKTAYTPKETIKLLGSCASLFVANIVN